MRVVLAISVVAILAVGLGPAGAVDSHLDPQLVPGGCGACHMGHGVSQSPMLPAPQSEVCLSCHQDRAGLDLEVSRGAVTPGGRTLSLGQVLARPFRHPLTEGAYSRREPGAVTCTSCHSPHRAMAEKNLASTTGRRKLSPRDPSQFEFELCQECHGSAGLGTQSPLDSSRLSNPNNRSYHPVEAPAATRSPSILPELVGAEINCTDCHGNSDPAGARGPHGSEVAYILKQNYTTVDGSAETGGLYSLCYECHDRSRVLDDSPFPLHRLHVVEERTSCATCHSAHGSIGNRGLIRFGEETFLAGVGPSMSTGLLRFESSTPGSGSCYLTCHGVDHSPRTYGFAVPTTDDGLGYLPSLLDSPGLPPSSMPPSRPSKRKQNRLPP